MNEPAQLALMHADIDGELDPRQRGELARALLGEPKARAMYDDLRRLCAALDALPAVEPPEDLRAGILAALPHDPRRRARALPGGLTAAWRYAAVLAGVVIAGTVLFETTRGPRLAGGEAAGTMASANSTATLDTVRVEAAPVLGSVRLYRDASGLALEFDLRAGVPVDAVVTGDGHTLSVSGLGVPDTAGTPPRRVRLSGFEAGTRQIEVTFVAGGRRVGSATLRAGGP